MGPRFAKFQINGQGAFVICVLRVGHRLPKLKQGMGRNRQTIRLEISEHGDLKTDESADEIEIDEALANELRAHKARNKGPFVIASSRPARVNLSGQYYRCESMFARLYNWLRDKGIDDKKPLHVLRKEFGSMINQKHGLYAASAALRHRNISTTAGHYVANKSRIMFEFGNLLTGSSVRPVRARAAQRALTAQKITISGSIR